MKRLALPLALVLGGCASTPAVQLRTVPVPITRIQRCIAPEDIPDPPALLGKRPSNDARVLADILLAKVRSWEGYGAVADPLLRGCAAITPPPE